MLFLNKTKKIKKLKNKFHSSKKEGNKSDIDENIEFQFITVKNAKHAVTLLKLCLRDMVEWEFGDYLVYLISLDIHLGTQAVRKQGRCLKELSRPLIEVQVSKKGTWKLEIQ